MKQHKLYRSGIIFLLIALFITACGGQSSSNTPSNSNSSSNSNTPSNSTAEKPSPAPEKTFELNLNNYNPSTNFTVAEALEPWKKMVERETNGRVKVNLFHGGSLGSVRAVLQDVENRVYEVGMFINHYYEDTSAYPLSIGYLPFALPTGDIAREAMTKLSEKYQDLIWGDLNVIPMGVMAAAPNIFLSKKPINSIEDVKNMGFRAGTTAEAEMVKSWGAVPVNLTLQEMYEALQKGIIEGNFYTSTGIKTQEMHMIAPYVIDLPLGTGTLTYIMNKDFYNELPDDLKKMFDEKFNAALADLTHQAYINHSEKDLQAIFDATGNDLIKLSPAELAKFHAPTEKIWAEWVNRANEKGMPGDEIMKDFRNFIVEAGGQLPF